MHAHEKMETTKLLLGLDNPRKASSKKGANFPSPSPCARQKEVLI
jgi:hypothetical protein